ncbi:glycosyltransferase [Aureisphaera galaxeae]|uniref:glycosyltransferase n=1 Tax=Aureisphaera galaxeae TaxID=1538023 RepID=UPI00234FF7C3|nr:glycosyltransferase [Aureisphaera galaxeae]MDC8004463.1 glycosyltransferase [Aureisphaera galaxeae]
MEQPKRKIALVGNTLSSGGAEKAQARLSIFLDSKGIEVHHILVTDKITYPYAGKVFNMGRLKNQSNDLFNKLKRLSALRKYLKQEKFDYIIDFRVKKNFLQENLIANWVYKAPYIMSIRSFNTDYYFPKQKAKASRIYRKSYGIVAVSKALQKKIETEFGYQNVHTIYNGLDFDEINTLAEAPHNLTFPYILGIGRMQSGIKQFDHLIEAFHDAAARQKGIHLVLVGEGEDLSKYKELVARLKLESEVHFIPFVENPFPYFKNAYVTALTSKFEGFPNVLIESLASGTPVMAYDCESGPSEIIEHEENGLLIANQDKGALLEAMDRLVMDSELYDRCKAQARQSVDSFAMEAIGQEWLRLLNIS